jgi:hypothetical protein
MVPGISIEFKAVGIGAKGNSAQALPLSSNAEAFAKALGDQGVRAGSRVRSRLATKAGVSADLSKAKHAPVKGAQFNSQNPRSH